MPSMPPLGGKGVRGPSPTWPPGITTTRYRYIVLVVGSNNEVDKDWFNPIFAASFDGIETVTAIETVVRGPALILSRE